MNRDLSSSNAGPVGDAQESFGPAQTAAAKAFIRSGQYFFGEVGLQPYSALRENVAMELGFRGGIVGESDIIEAETSVDVEVMEPDLDGAGQPIIEDGQPKMRVKTLDGKPVMESREKTVVIYKQFPRDVQIVIWTCLQTDAACFKALRKPEWGLGEAMKWAERENVRWGTPKFEQAAKAFGEIMEDRRASYAVPESEAGKKNDSPGN